MRQPFLIGFILFIGITCKAQQSKYTAFTVNDGLPSNYVYRAIEDNKGFLWIATDAGIARFDGKHFQVFTTRDGLPDNEVLAVVKESNGRIWVNCFKQKPAYFDEIKNRFINSKDDPMLAKIPEGTHNMYFFPLQNGGMLFYYEQGSVILKNGKIVTSPIGKKHNGFIFNENKDGTFLSIDGAVNTTAKTSITAIYQLKDTKKIDSIIIRHNVAGESLTYGLSDGKFYLFNSAKGVCYIYSDFNCDPLHFKAVTVKVPEPFNNFEFTRDNFYFTSVSGKLYLYNKKTLTLEAVIHGDYLPNSIYKDHKGNLWVSTIDKGLLIYKKNQLGLVNLPRGFIGTNFLSIARKPNGAILAGNFYGEIVEAGKRSTITHTVPKKDLISRQRKIVLSQNKIFSFSEGGVYINYNKTVVDYGKTALNFNDSIILIGQSFGLQKLNAISNKITILRSLSKRVTALTVNADSMVYFGSTDGLYKFNYNKNITTPLNQKDSRLRERITGLCATPDQLIWVATSGNGLLVVKDDKVLLHISEKDGIIDNATRSITTGRPGQIWLGTSGGISIINYKLQNGKPGYTIQNLSVNDGLTDNVINEMLYQKDTVYAATGNGISIIPAAISIPKFNIPVQLIHISINQRDTVLASSYKLGYNQQNIQMAFAGIELNGHFKNLQYTLDKNKNWTTLDGNTITVQLSSGIHTVQVRAVDVNGNICNKILTVKFDIATPFWKSIWFWFIVALTTQLLIIYLINQRQKKRREDKLAKEIAGVQTAALEQQAFTSLMNPHFMFNALNSIQHYMNVQDRQNTNRYLSDFASLIRKNFEAAQQSFIPLEQEIENITIYLRLEKMRFSNRFSYSVTIDENLDTDDWVIPTMILQPLLENALLHGIMPSSINGEINIALKHMGKDLLIMITDNGIGIANSMALKAGDTHKSRGMELIKKRIAALSRFGPQAITITVLPAFISEENPGNQVILFIPHQLHHAWMQAQQQ